MITRMKKYQWPPLNMQEHRQQDKITGHHQKEKQTRPSQPAERWVVAKTSRHLYEQTQNQVNWRRLRATA